MKKTASILKNKFLFAIAAWIIIGNTGNAQTVPPIWPAKSISMTLDVRKNCSHDTSAIPKRKRKSVKYARKNQNVSDSVFINLDKKLKDSVLKTWKY